MATYNFTETDKTLASSFVNNTSNIVFLPINSTWGPTDEVVEINSVKGLANTFGSVPETETATSRLKSKNWPENITSYAYAQGVLNSGLSLAIARMTDTNATQAKWTALKTEKSASNEELQSWAMTKEKKEEGSETYVYTFSGSTKYTDTNPVTVDPGVTLTFTEVTSSTNAQIVVALDKNGVLSCTKESTEASAGDWETVYKYYNEKKNIKATIASYTYYDDILELGLKTQNAVYEWEQIGPNNEYIGIKSTSTIYEQANLIINTDKFKAKYVGTYGNDISVYFNTQLKSKTYTKFSKVGRYDSSTQKFTQVSVNGTYTYALVLNVLVGSSIKEQIEIATIDFILNDPGLTTFSEIPSYKFNVYISDIVSDYIDIDEFVIEMSQPSEWTEPLATTTSQYSFTGGTDTTEENAQTVFENFLKNASDTKYESLIDKWQTDIKFVSGGPFVSTTIAEGLIAIANERADCIAFVDHDKSLTTATSVEQFAESLTKSSYAALYSPWCLGYPSGSTDSTAWMPASYYAITSIGKSFSKGNSICDVPAGVNRGAVTIVKPSFEIGRSTMEKWQKGENTDLNYCINPIMKVRNYGYCIFGQRNLLELAYGTTSALQEVGVRLTLNEIKKWVRDVCIGLTFESNSNRTWNEFVTRVSQCLNTLKNGGFLTDYNVYRDSSNLTEQTNTNSLDAVIQVYVTRALENFNINVEVYSGEITLTEE